MSKSTWLFLEKVLSVGIIAIVVLALTTAVLKDDLIVGHDIFAHATYTKIFTHALSEGQFPVRWVENVWSGHSQPLFNFYQVGFYYFYSLIALLGFSSVSSLNLSVLVLWLLGCLFIFLFTKRFGLLSATFATVIYAFSPYLILDVFIRNSFPEFTAVIFLTGTLWALDRLLLQGKTVYFFLFSLLLGLAFISHLPASLIFLPIFMIYSLILLVIKETTWLKLLHALGGFLLSIGVAAFYLFPAVTELNLVRIGILHSNSFDFHNHFADPNNLYSYIWGYWEDWWGEESKLALFMGVIPWTIAVISLVGNLLLRKNIKLISLSLFSLITLLFALFFTFNLSEFFWEKISAMEFIQFPWRFFMLTPISFAILSALLFHHLKRIQYQVVSLLIIFLLIINIYPIFLAPGGIISGKPFNLPFTEWRKDKVVKSEAFIEKGYNPLGVNILPTEDIGVWKVTEGESQVTEVEIKDDKKVLQIEAKAPTALTINTHYFPGWKAYLDGNETAIVPTPDYYFLNIEVPEGEHLLEVKFTNTPIRSAANVITLFSVFLIVVLGLYSLALSFLRKARSR